MKKQRIVAAVLSLVMILALGLTGCGGAASSAPAAPASDAAASPASDAAAPSDAAPAPAAGDMSVEVIAKGFQHDFWKAVRLGSEKAAEELGVKMNFVGPEGEGAIAAQVEMLTNAINKKPSAICLAALDTSASIDAIGKAVSAGIPIVGFDSGVPDAPAGSIAANAATDNYKAGEMAAEKMFPAIKDKVTAAAAGTAVRIGVVSQEANSQSITQRTAGFTEKMVALIEALPEYGAGKVAVTGHDKFANKVDAAAAKTVLEVRIPAAIEDAAGKTEAQALLEKADLIAIYGSNEFAAKAIINANDALAGGKIGKDKVIAVGFDSGALQIDAIKSGAFFGSVTQDPVSIGYNAVKLAVAAAKGETVADVDTGCQWYDSTNVEDPAIAPLLYQ